MYIVLYSHTISCVKRLWSLCRIWMVLRASPRIIFSCASDWALDERMAPDQSFQTTWVQYGRNETYHLQCVPHATISEWWAKPQSSPRHHCVRNVYYCTICCTARKASTIFHQFSTTLSIVQPSHIYSNYIKISSIILS